MAKKVVYNINGFDCPNCANKAVIHLNKQSTIENASIDFNNGRLFVTYKDQELSIEELLILIGQVESDEIELTYLEDKEEKEYKLFNKEMVVVLCRIFLSLLLALIAKFAFKEDQFLISLIIYGVALAISLYDIFFKFLGNVFHLRNPLDMNLLLSISSIGVIVLGSLIHYEVIPPAPFEIEIFDGVLVVVLYQVGELFEHIASNKSRIAIKKATDLRAKTANLIRDDKIVVVNPKTLQIGDKIVISVGDNIPVDGVVIKGNGSIDTSSLTGEPIPVDVKDGEEVLSGTILKSGSLIIEVKKAFADSTVSKIMEIVENSGENKSRAEKFINNFARVYTPIIFAIGIIYIVAFGFATSMWTNALFGGLAIFVVSCPCAIVISVPLAFFAGIGLESKYGIIVKGSSYLDALCRIKKIYVDKTGTLTYGNFKIDEIVPINASKEELLQSLYIAESRSNHPLAKAIFKGVDSSKFVRDLQTFEEFSGQGVIAQFDGNTIYAGKREFLLEKSVKVQQIEANGTIICVAKNGQYLGYVVLKDEIKEEAKQLIKNLAKYKIKVAILSGDKESVVKEVADILGVEEYHSGLLPIDKYKIVESEILKDNKELIAFAGDGINDTPSILRADVGFAMGKIGSDIVIDNADVVVMNDDPNKVFDAIKIARKTRLVAIINIVFSLFVKALVITLVLTGLLGRFGMIAAVAADTGLTVVMIIHSLSLLYRKV